MMLNIQKIRDYKEKKIQEKIDQINDPFMDPGLKRIIALNELNSSLDYSFNPPIIDFPSNTMNLFDIEKVREFREKKINEKILNKEYEELSMDEKRLKALNELNTSSSSNNEEEKIEEEEKEEIEKEEGEKKEKENNKEIEKVEVPKESIEKPVNKTNIIDINDSTKEFSSTCFSSKILALNINKILTEYWIKYELYDVKLKFDYLIFPEICLLKEEIYCYLYKNELITYYFIKNSRFFGKEYEINEDIITDKDYNEIYGLFFCGKRIEFEDNEIQECSPNKMICKECMEKNKKRHKLKDIDTINIIGRASTKRKGSFHCFGKFFIGNQIETCLQKFSCEGCKLLDKYEKYYFPEE